MRSVSRRRVWPCVADAVLVVAAAAGRSSPARDHRPGTLILFSVQWATGADVTDPNEITYEVCGVEPGGRSYRLTKSDIGTLSTDGTLSPSGIKLAYTERGSL